jgi:iron(II)-dependent oxidoreductase
LAADDKATPKRLNLGESGLGTTSAVGVYPEGASDYGCEEMSGNVLDWTLSKGRDYPYVLTDGRETIDGKNDVRVLRGGCFAYLVHFARCADRDRGGPVFRDYGAGFRLICAPISSEL